MSIATALLLATVLGFVTGILFFGLVRRSYDLSKIRWPLSFAKVGLILLLLSVFVYNFFGDAAIGDAQIEGMLMWLGLMSLTVALGKRVQGKFGFKGLLAFGTFLLVFWGCGIGSWLFY